MNFLRLSEFPINISVNCSNRSIIIVEMLASFF